MLSFFRRYKDVLVVGVLLIAPLVSYLSSGHRGREPNAVDRLVLQLSTPVQWLLTWTLTSLFSVGESYVGLRGAHEEAGACRAALGEANAELNVLREAQAENLRLKEVLDYVKTTPHEEIVARVIGLNPSPQYLSMRINRGENDGVHVGMPVVTVDGAVGQVVRAVGSAADVLLITDPSSRIGGLVQRTRVRATVTGTGDGRQLLVDLVRREDDMRDGDAVVSAGTDGIYPPGIPLGILRSPERPGANMFRRAMLDPAVDLSRVEEVLVIPTSAEAPPATEKPRP